MLSQARCVSWRTNVHAKVQMEIGRIYLKGLATGAADALGAAGLSPGIRFFSLSKVPSALD